MTTTKSLTPMNATIALDIMKQAIVAADYLENKAQETVNANGFIIAEMVKAKEDVDGSEMFKSWKVKTNTTKFGKACVKMIQVAEAHQAWEAKQKAITTTATPKAKELIHA